MRYLAIDIGAGTQDILLYDSFEKIENAVKLVYPSPTKRLSYQVLNADKNLFVSGNIIGGGPVTRALKAHIAKGFDIFISQNAAHTVRDDLSIVVKEGFTVVEDVLQPDILFEEIDLDLINSLNDGIGDNKPIDQFFVAAQDHGYVPGQSDRVSRMDFLIPFIEKGLRNAFFSSSSEIPKHFTRWNSLKNDLLSKNIKNYCITDTAVIAALGALHGVSQRPVITIDAGNGHIFAALIDRDDSVAAFFEHHTTMLDSSSVWKWIDLLKKGEISFDAIFDDGGHGAHSYRSCSYSDIPVIVTGPNRSFLFDEADERVTFAAPIGDMMITGPVGMFVQQGII